MRQYKKLSLPLTSYDLLKSSALILMLIDHIGYYFFPDDLMWRSIGRACIPIWGFLIGYSLTRRNDPALWIGTALFAIIAFISGDNLLPLSILMTFILCRACLPLMEHITLSGQKGTLALIVVLVVLNVPATLLIQYGLQIFLFALAGRFYRVPNLSSSAGISARMMMIISIIYFILFQSVAFGFTQLEMLIAFLGCLITGMFCLFFKEQILQHLDDILPKPVKNILKICGRYTLEIYLMHILILACLSQYMGIGDRLWFHPSLF
ncbi:MAG: hypothetical protein J0L77_08210 [Alphaproteobacteria bacterium]|nr:hypothetical protein [Alphaproteobacteria bacterium]